MRRTPYFGLLAWLALWPTGLLADESVFDWNKPAQPVTRAEFEKKYRAWQERVLNDFGHFSNMGQYLECREYEQLAQLGVSAVPFCVEEIEYSHKVLRDRTKLTKDQRFAGGHLLVDAVEKMTRKRFKDSAEVLSWWHSRDQVPEQFQKAYAGWKAAKKKGTNVLETKTRVFDEATKQVKIRVIKTDLGEAYATLRGLGIDALPLIIEQLKKGDYDLLPLFDELNGDNGPSQIGTVKEQTRAALDWWEFHKAAWTLPPPMKDKKE